MKLRTRQNSLRLRLNRKEVDELAAGTALQEEIRFPGSTKLVYVLEPFNQGSASASFVDGIISIAAPGADIREWAHSDAIGIYFNLMADGSPLKIAIEKDLECLDGPEEERDPNAFSRESKIGC